LKIKNQPDAAQFFIERSVKSLELLADKAAWVAFNSWVEESTIDVFEVLAIVRRKWAFVLLSSLAVAAAYGGLQYFNNSTYFASRATILVGNADVGINLGALSQFLPRAGSSNSQMGQFEKMLKTQSISRIVQEKLSHQKELGRQLRFIVKTDAVSLEIEFRATSPEFALVGAQAYLDALAEMVQEASTSKARANEAFVKARLNEAEAALAKLENRIPGMRLSEASREQQIQTKVVLVLREQYELAQIETKKQQQSFQVIDPPSIPRGPEGGWSVKPAFMIFVLMLFFSSILSVIGSYFLEEKKRRGRGRAKA